jgi:hypothetical protein
VTDPTTQTPTTQPTVPSTSTPSTQQLVAELIQDGALALGALGLSTPAIFSNPSVDYQIAGAVLTIGGIVYSLYDKFKTAKATHASAVASARMRAPVRPL